MLAAPFVQSTVNQAIGASSVAFGAMTGTNLYILTASVACWIAVGTAPVAAANAAGSMYVPANTPILLAGPGQGNAGVGNQPAWQVAVIQASSGGEASLARCITSS